MARNLFYFLIIATIFINFTYSLTSQCPSASRISSCGPICKDNSNCPGAQMCCSNICNTKTCTDIYQYLSDKDKSKGTSSKYGATGTYCGNVKCNANEKCELDRTTKRQKCVRG